MKKIILVALLIHGVFFGQSTLPNVSVPTFYNSNELESAHSKLENIKKKTQEFIAENLNDDFVKKHFNPGDSIEFNFSYIVGKDGYIISNKTSVNTTVDFFNNEITSILNKLPKFKPALAIYTKEFYEYTINCSPEYYIDNNYKFKPIYRENINNTIQIHSGEKELIETAIKYGYSSEHNYFNNAVYFTLDDSMSIKNIRTYFEIPSFGIKVKKVIENIDLKQYPFFSQLQSNKNYSIDVTLKTSENYNNLTYTYQESASISLKDIDSIAKNTIPYNNIEFVPIYPGCEKEKDNTKRSDCLNKKISRFISKKFDPPKFNLGGAKQFRIHVFFKIDSLGQIIDIKTMAPHPVLEKEAKRVISLLPKMIKPGFQDGKPVTVSYYLPLVFDTSYFDITKDPLKLDETPFRNN